MSQNSHNKGLKKVGGVLSKVASSLGLDKRLKERALLDLWPSLAPSRLAHKTRAMFIDFDGNIVIAVKDAPTGQELSLLKPKLLRSLSQAAKHLGLNIKGLRLDLKQFYSHNLDANQSLEQTKYIPPLPTNKELADINLEPCDLEELEKLKKELQQAGDYLKENSEHSEKLELGQRIAGLFERELRLKRWRLQKDFPICTNCQSPCDQLHGAKSECSTCFCQNLSESRNF